MSVLKPFVRRVILTLWVGWISAASLFAQVTYQDIHEPPHRYRDRTPTDSFTRLIKDFESGSISLDRSSQLAFLRSLLKALDIPASSQMLVYSTTSLQLSLISPSNPRALYFNEELYLGYIPGGKIEIISIDPDLGGIFYIFEIPKSDRPLKIERSARCMNCHSGSETGYVPGLVIKSVIPGPTGGSLNAYRVDQHGHSIPYPDRFGGWHVTGKHGITQHWGNLIGDSNAGILTLHTNPPGKSFRFDPFPSTTSDVLAQALHEHQAGFVNRMVEATYRARTLLHLNPGPLGPEQVAELEDQARKLTRYLLFADEAPMPLGGIEGDAAFRTEFLRNRRTSADGLSLKDFELSTRLFKHRCSYMIYSPLIQGAPPILKKALRAQLIQALQESPAHSEFQYLPGAEKAAIRQILKATSKEFANAW